MNIIQMSSIHHHDIHANTPKDIKAQPCPLTIDVNTINMFKTIGVVLSEYGDIMEVCNFVSVSALSHALKVCRSIYYGVLSNLTAEQKAYMSGMQANIVTKPGGYYHRFKL